MAAGNASMEGVFKKGGGRNGKPTQPPSCLALKLYKLKFNCLQAAYNAASTSFHSEMRLGNCSGMGYSQDEGLRIQDSGLGTPTIWLQARN